jgi:type IV pilus assembly protein PilB
MIVCVGPTGSGKTTTLYATLRSIDARERSITTIEDPVEYVFPDVTQIPINEAAGVTFASGLRAVLRQDPDVILVGEIRDEETARIAITAALTGHLVFSSLHATDSVSALYRFIDMGVEPFLVASSVRAIVAQRLVRRVCTGCQQPHQLGAEEAAFWERIGGDLSTEFVQGQGCNRCGGSGYLERVGLYEVLRVTEGLAERLVSNRSSSEAMRRIAIEEGLITLRDESVRLVAEGQSTVAEVLRSVHAV